MGKGKGTQSFGKRHFQRTHTLCRRCGKVSYHKQKHQCASCGFPAKKTRKYVGWGTKVRGRRGQGTGRMSYLKDLPRRAKNNFREGTTPRPRTRKAK